MPKLTQLRRETGEVTIQTDGDEPLVVTYRKAFISPDLAARFEVADDLPPAQQLGVLADLVRHAVVSWNLTDDNGMPLPVCAETIGGLDAGALQIIAQAIQEAMRPDPLSGNGSSSDSAAARSEPSPIGTAS